MKITNIIAASLLMLVSVPTASAQEKITFAYASKDALVSPIGTMRTDTYDVAIALTSPSVYGMSITEVQVPVMPTDLIADFSIWFSHELKLEQRGAYKYNAPDVSYNAVMPADGDDIEWITLSLEQPYVIPDGGLYVGYSFTVTAIDDTKMTKTPVVATSGKENGSLWLHTTRTYRSWSDQSESLNAISMMQVTLEGNTMPENAARLGEMPFKYVALGSENSINVMVYNLGTNQISTLNYTSMCGDAVYEGVASIDPPILASFGYGQEVEFVLPELKATGPTNVNIEITAVNGTQVSGVSASGEVNVAAFVPKHNALVEEYTGMWCGNCPRGFVAMEKMNEWYPDFIGIAYHNKDDLAMESGDPGMTVAFPSAFIDRRLECDPYYADPSLSVFSLPSVWSKYCADFAPASVEVKAVWDPDLCTVTAESTVNWAVVPEDVASADYRLEYVLVADDLSYPTWYQSNYYADGQKGYPEYMEEFCYAPAWVFNLHYNDVAMMTSGFKGVANSIPSVGIDQPTTHTYVFDTNEAYTAAGEKFPFSPDRLRVVAMLIKNGGAGQVVNSAKCNVVNNSGIGNVDLDKHPVSVTYYDFSGRLLTSPHGICVRRICHSGGSVRHDKVILP